jgi:DNA-binding response OmpR family regulator
MDLVMPGKDGISTIEEIRESGDKTPIVVLTGKVSKVEVENSITAGANDYFNKPITVDKIELLLERFGKEGDGVDIIEMEHLKLDNDTVFDISEGEKQLGSRSFYLDLIKDFIENLGSRFDTIDQLVESKKYDQLKSHIHSIKGMASNLYLNNIYLISKELESHIKGGEFRYIVGRVSLMKIELQKLKNYYDSEMVNEA